MSTPEKPCITTTSEKPSVPSTNLSVRELLVLSQLEQAANPEIGMPSTKDSSFSPTVAGILAAAVNQAIDLDIYTEGSEASVLGFEAFGDDDMFVENDVADTRKTTLPTISSQVA